ncbi:hypothetical protein RFI_08462 [Reticulomyxa filosa]|uniref:MORN repeat-containing protein n=1 Tax=Reticulomyxa filosa TaxID=46433 RepID=X6NRV1_RETFI|nr:hypothetical protein RFI_08462 [Reticulomyxa filosa]|eukprot:ETO28668.1 hypothetical protein RFI_08462 [Reticulomyxa filosa]
MFVVLKKMDTNIKKHGNLHGEGRYTWHDEVTYRGNFENNQMTGFGEYQFDQYSKYSGYVHKGIRNGKGCLIVDIPTKSDERYIETEKKKKPQYFERDDNSSIIAIKNVEDCTASDDKTIYREYRGFWTNGLRDEEGVLYYNKEKTSYYKGEWKKGQCTLKKEH